jgi:plastocyanin
MGAHASATPDAFEKVLMSAKRTPSSTLGCTAHEIALFAIANTTPVSERLRRHMAGRCGSTWALVGYQLIQGTFDGAKSDAALAAFVTDSMNKHVAGFADNHDVGVGVARNGNAFVVALTHATRPATITWTSQRADHNVVVVEGSARDNVAFVSGYVTLGRLRAAPCVRDDAVLAPSFRLSCPTDPHDDTARISIYAQRRNARLGNVVAELMVLPGTSDAKLYKPVHDVAPVPMPALDDLPAALLAQINIVRSKDGLAPLTLATQESETARTLVPHYVEAMHPDDAAAREVLALGLLAGWQVEGGLIHDGLFSSSVQSIDGGLDVLLGQLLDDPSQRAQLLDKEGSTIAVGAGNVGPSGNVALLMTTYNFVHKSDHTADGKRLFDDLTRVRQARGFAGLGEAAVEDVAARASVRIEAGDDLDVVMRDFLNASVKKMHRSMRAYSFRMTSFNNIPWPDALLKQSPTYTTFALGVRKAPGSAWAEYVVMFVVFVDEQSTTDATPVPSGSTLPARTLEASR